MICTRLSDTEFPLTELALWLIGAPAGALLTLFTYSSIPRAANGHIDSLLSSAICTPILLLLIWNLAWSALAHLATFSVLPRLLKRPLIRLISTIGTQHAKQIVMRSSAGAAIGLGLMTGGMSGIAFAAPADLPSDSQSTNNMEYDLAWGAPQRPSPGQNSSSVSPSTARPQSTQMSVTETPTQTPTQSSMVSATPPHAPPKHAINEPTPDHSKETPPSTGQITVTPGQSLWSISADLLGPDASDADIATFWRVIYAMNSNIIGSDPNLIHPGQQLTLPKEQP